MQRFTFREQLAAAFAAIVSTITVAASAIGAAVGSFGTMLV